jgi:hypothetical protein
MPQARIAVISLSAEILPNTSIVETKTPTGMARDSAKGM